MENRDVLLALLKSGHEVIEGTIEGVTDEVAAWKPAGTAHPIGATYLHVAIGEDNLINGHIKGGAPLHSSTWAGKLGATPEPPMNGTGPWDAWVRSVKVDMAAARSYAAAVFASTEAYLASASQAELDRMVDSLIPGMPQMAVAAFIASIPGTHVAHHTGEISAIKGEQGLKGYPF